MNLCCQNARGGVRDLIKTIWLARFSVIIIGDAFAVKILSSAIPKLPAAANDLTSEK
jgi:hypothetical protein